jgi:hypothetical protein
VIHLYSVFFFFSSHTSVFNPILQIHKHSQNRKSRSNEIKRIGGIFMLLPGILLADFLLVKFSLAHFQFHIQTSLLSESMSTVLLG